MKKWYAEEYEFTVEVTGFLRGDHTERYCRNGEEIGDTYHCTYGCPVNQDGQGICSKTMMMLYPLMEAVRSGGDLTYVGGEDKYEKTIVCPDGCVMFRLTAVRLATKIFIKASSMTEPPPHKRSIPFSAKIQPVCCKSLRKNAAGAIMLLGGVCLFFG